MKLCILGNSHSAALKIAWVGLRAAVPGAEVAFLAARGDTMKDLKFEHNRLVAGSETLVADLERTYGDYRQVRLDAFDAIGLVGLRFAPQRLSAVARVFAYVDPAFPPGKRLVSRECFLQAVHDALRTSVAIGLARQLRSLGHRVLLVPQPFLSANWRGTPAFDEAFGAAPAPFWAALGETWRQAAAEAAREADVELIAQPGSTVDGGFFTDARFSRRFTKVDGSGTDDLRHMNASYGEIMLREMFARLQRPATIAA